MEPPENIDAGVIFGFILFASIKKLFIWLFCVTKFDFLIF